MVSIENVPSMKYVTKQLKMPFNSVNMTEDYMAVLLIKDSTQSLSILSNKMLYRDIKYNRYYKPNEMHTQYVGEIVKVIVEE